MSDHTKSARAKAEAEFQKVQSEARDRDRIRDRRHSETQARDDNTARLKALRLAADGAEKREAVVKQNAAEARSHAASAADKEMAGIEATADQKVERRKALTDEPALVAKARTKRPRQRSG
ncbi:hypothetical protein [Enterovirga aerilata]|uniref:Uncharacterized protein n=1 Tax=Enterovirga aerilata TaxID=2730920 RepID=A0A849I6S7_9HYPH|nr:hypothetical protein [Enterovirga sp. DB1703]NNM73424.1 hypothetical protein [Enterovirga sp. DB1703]